MSANFLRGGNLVLLILSMVGSQMGFFTQTWADTVYMVFCFLSFDDAAGCYCEAKGQIIFIVKEHNEFVKDDVTVWLLFAVTQSDICTYPAR